MAFYQGKIFDLRSDPNAISNFGKMGLDLRGMKNRKDSEQADRQFRQEQADVTNQQRERQIGQGDRRLELIEQGMAEDKASREQLAQGKQQNTISPDDYLEGYKVWMDRVDALADETGGPRKGREREFADAMNKAKQYFQQYETLNSDRLFGREDPEATARENFPDMPESELQQKIDVYRYNMNQQYPEPVRPYGSLSKPQPARQGGLADMIQQQQDFNPIDVQNAKVAIQRHSGVDAVTGATPKGTSQQVDPRDVQIAKSFIKMYGSPEKARAAGQASVANKRTPLQQIAEDYWNTQK